MENKVVREINSFPFDVFKIADGVTKLLDEVINRERLKASLDNLSANDLDWEECEVNFDPQEKILKVMFIWNKSNYSMNIYFSKEKLGDLFSNEWNNQKEDNVLIKWELDLVGPEYRQVGELVDLVMHWVGDNHSKRGYDKFGFINLKDKLMTTCSYDRV